MKTISFLLFGPVLCPGGGMKIILEHANRLVAAGYNVNIVYPGTINWKSRSLIYKLKSVYHYFLHEKQGVTCSRWFKMNPMIKEFHPWNLSFKNIPQSDIYIATEVRTAPYVAKYPVDESNKFYFIQDFEEWFVSKDFVFKTFHLPLNKIVISSWLLKLLNNIGEKAVVVPNGFDFEYFKQTIPIANRNKYAVSMLYHESPRKNCEMAFKALKLVKKQFPDLTVLIFGTPPRPAFLPDWYTYTQCPTKEQHNKIYNSSAIFIGTSIAEGWGLTVGEAMICGATVACTNTDGYKEMAKHEYNALISPINDHIALSNNIIRLIKNDELRIRLAQNAVNDIKKFTWDNSFQSMKLALKLS